MSARKRSRRPQRRVSRNSHTRRVSRNSHKRRVSRNSHKRRVLCMSPSRRTYRSGESPVDAASQVMNVIFPNDGSASCDDVMHFYPKTTTAERDVPTEVRCCNALVCRNGKEVVCGRVLQKPSDTFCSTHAWERRIISQRLDGFKPKMRDGKLNRQQKAQMLMLRVKAARLHNGLRDEGDHRGAIMHALNDLLEHTSPQHTPVKLTPESPGSPPPPGPSSPELPAPEPSSPRSATQKPSSPRSATQEPSSPRSATPPPPDDKVQALLKELKGSVPQRDVPRELALPNFEKKAEIVKTRMFSEIDNSELDESFVEVFILLRPTRSDRVGESQHLFRKPSGKATPGNKSGKGSGPSEGKVNPEPNDVFLEYQFVFVPCKIVNGDIMRYTSFAYTFHTFMANLHQPLFTVKREFSMLPPLPMGIGVPHDADAAPNMNVMYRVTEHFNNGVGIPGRGGIEVFRQRLAEALAPHRNDAKKFPPGINSPVQHSGPGGGRTVGTDEENNIIARCNFDSSFTPVRNNIPRADNCRIVGHGVAMIEVNDTFPHHVLDWKILPRETTWWPNTHWITLYENSFSSITDDKMIFGYGFRDNFKFLDDCLLQAPPEQRKAWSNKHNTILQQSRSLGSSGLGEYISKTFPKFA